MGLTTKIIITTATFGLISYGVMGYVRNKALADNSSVDLKSIKAKIVHFPSEMQVSGIVTADNRTDFPLHVIAQSLSVYLDGKYVSDIKSSQNQLIPQRGFVDIPFSVNFNPLQIIGETLSNINDLTGMSLSIKGTITVRTGVWFARMPIDITHSLSEIL